MDSYLTKEAKKDIRDMLDIGSGGGGSDSGLFVVTTINVDTEDTTTIIGDMTKAEILQALSDKKIVMARIEEGEDIYSGFVTVFRGSLIVKHVPDSTTYAIPSNESDDCTTWTWFEESTTTM